jgi:hypothetical protein
MMHGRFGTRCVAAIVLAMVCVAAWVASAAASVAYNGTRGLIRTRSADTFHKGTLSFQISEQYGKQNDEKLGPSFFGSASDSALVDFHTFITRASLTYALSDFLRDRGKSRSAQLDAHHPGRPRREGISTRRRAAALAYTDVSA